MDENLYHALAVWETKVGKPYSMYFVDGVIHHEDHLFHNHSKNPDIIQLAEWDRAAFNATFFGREWFWIDDRTCNFTD